MFGDAFSDSLDALEDLAGALGIRDFESILFIECHHQLQGIHRVQTEAARAEKRLLVPNFVRGDLQHQVSDHQLLDVLP